MKKICIGMIVCLLSVCMGCGKSYKQEQSVENNTQYITSAQSYYVNNKVADDGYGYYFTDGIKDKYYRIYYYDDGCEQAVPLCSKVNCDHKSQECDSYYTADQCYNGYIWYHNDRLFRLERDVQTGDVKLISFNKDGSNEKSEGVLWNGENITINRLSDYEKNIILHKGYIYYCYSLDVQENVTVYRLEIGGTGKKEQIGTTKKTDFEVQNRHIAVYNNDDYIYITADYSVKGSSEHLMELHEYDIKNGGFALKMSEFGELDYAYKYDENGENILGVTGTGFEAIDLRNITFDNNRNMYIYKSITGEVFKINLNTDETELIYQDDGYGIITYDGTYLYLNQKDTGSFSKEFKINVIDLSGNYIKQIDCGKAANSYPGGNDYIFMKKRVNSENIINSEGKNVTVQYLLYNLETGESKVIFEGAI